MKNEFQQVPNGELSGNRFTDASGTDIEIVRSQTRHGLVVSAIVNSGPERFGQLESPILGLRARTVRDRLEIDAELLHVDLEALGFDAHLMRGIAKDWSDAVDKSRAIRRLGAAEISRSPDGSLTTISGPADSRLPEFVFVIARILPLKHLFAPPGVFESSTDPYVLRSQPNGYGLYVIRLRNRQGRREYYVGQSAHSPEERYRQHRLGIRAGRGVQGSAVSIAWRWFEKRPRYKLQSQAKQEETALAERMRSKGLVVRGGH